MLLIPLGIYFANFGTHLSYIMFVEVIEHGVSVQVSVELVC